jgi:succinate dehydrogenase hydrophobic anchor subunit
MAPSLCPKQHFRNPTFRHFAFLMLTSIYYSCLFLRNVIKNTITYHRLPTLLITLLPINIAIQITMLVIILRPIPINYYHNTLGSITIISDQLYSI